MSKSAVLVENCALARPAEGGCSWCSTALPKGRRMWCRGRCATAFWNNHWWPRARRAAKRRDKYACVRCGGGRPIEVNHIVPCLGAHGTISCAHHLKNLETLCARCHRAHTAAQSARLRASTSTTSTANPSSSRTRTSASSASSTGS